MKEFLKKATTVVKNFGSSLLSETKKNASGAVDAAPKVMNAVSGWVKENPATTSTIAGIITGVVFYKTGKRLFGGKKNEKK